MSGAFRSFFVPKKGSLRARLHERVGRIWRTLRGRNSRARLAVSIGVGTFIGCLPLFGLHIWLCLAVCVPLRLDTVAAYLASNVSNPVVAPFLVLAELEIGSYLLRGAPMPLDLDGVRQLSIGDVISDALLGSVVLGSVLGISFGGLAYFLSRRPTSEPGDEGTSSPSL